MNIRSSSPVYPSHSPYFGEIAAVRRFDFSKEILKNAENPIDYMKNQMNSVKDSNYTEIPQTAVGYATDGGKGEENYRDSTLFFCLKKDKKNGNDPNKIKKGEAWVVFSDVVNDPKVDAIKTGLPDLQRDRLRALAVVKKLKPTRQVLKNNFSWWELIRSCFKIKSADLTFHSFKSSVKSPESTFSARSGSSSKNLISQNRDH
jgi:hypothetical protein